MWCSGRIKAENIRPEQKWEFISLNDFHSTSYLNPFAYAYLWASLVISVAVYGVDTFTAVNLLAYDRWSSEIDPFIPISISKWIFSVCIIASLVNLAFEHLRAIRIIRRGAVAESYLDSLAARLQCTRFWSGWKRFLVFAELTKSKKGAEYVALFTYFSLQAWVRIIFCQGPRQVINALTLYSYLESQYDSNQHDISASILTFIKNIGILADKNQHQVLILSGMVFTLIIWGFGALRLVLALLAYILFLWHYIPNADGGLSNYCERKINTRLAKIVSVKVNKAIEEEERKRLKADAKAVSKGNLPQGREATLPKIFSQSYEEKLLDMPISPLVYSTHTSSPTDSLFRNTSGHSHNLSHSGSQVTISSFSSKNESKKPLLQKPSDMRYIQSMSPLPSPLENRDLVAPKARGINDIAWTSNSSSRYKLISNISTPSTPAHDIDFRSEGTTTPGLTPNLRTLDVSRANSSYQLGGTLFQNDPQSISRPETATSHIWSKTPNNMRFVAAQGDQRINTPPPYYSRQIYSPNFPSPRGLNNTQ